MKKFINNVVLIVLWLAYLFVGYHSVITMFILLMQSNGLMHVIGAIVTDIIWGFLLFIGGVLLYSITIKNKKDGTY